MLQQEQERRDTEARERFKPHQRGGGCCSLITTCPSVLAQLKFQTPSAGRWVLQHEAVRVTIEVPSRVSNPISGEVGAAANPTKGILTASLVEFQTPSAGRWVLQHAAKSIDWENTAATFQTPSAGRWVLQPDTTPMDAMISVASFKPHQRGGGCCS